LKKLVFLCLALLLFLILIPGCITFPTQPTNPTTPVIVEFSSNPSTIDSGSTSTLLWNVTGATSVSINQGIGQVDVAGTRVVSPNTSTTYTITASNSAGSVTASAVIMITSPGLPLISSFTANPSTINAGESSNLQWNIADATSVSINQGIGSVSSSGTRTVNPTVSTTYTITASNSAGSVTASAVIMITSPGLPLISSFTANPITINSGQSSTLSWNITGATSASISAGIGTVNATSGTHQVSPNTNTTYTLTATNATGSSTAQVTVTMGVAGQPVINSFTANPITINSGQSSTLSWNITGATSASISAGIGTVNATSGTYVVTPAATITYTLTAANSVGSVTTTATVTVSGANFPVINSFTANPTIVTSGGASTLTWSVTGATTLSINQGIGNLLTSAGTTTVTPTATTTYTITASNSYGSVTAQVTIMIGTASLPVIVSFTASPSTISVGQYSNLSYIIQGSPTSVSIDQGVGTVSQFGATVNPTTTTTYTLTATNSSGSVTRTVTVTVQ
jgi:hypothetical protein